MLIFKKIQDLKHFIDNQKAKGNKIGFVPTMGALHAGHVSLVEESKKQCQITVCSIFVNPTQFNDKSDLERYPRTPEKDRTMLEEANCDVLFMPEVHEMYPMPDTRTFDFGQLDKVMDGAHRRGHFNGVAQIVSKLVDAVEPHNVYFGKKDWQQLLIVREMVRQLKYKLNIIGCEIVREDDGLAMSSRNRLLNDFERSASNIIPQLMFDAVEMKKSGIAPSQIRDAVINTLGKQPYKLDYFEIRDENTLEELVAFDAISSPRAFIACFVGKVRLIDNISLL